MSSCGSVASFIMSEKVTLMMSSGLCRLGLGDYTFFTEGLSYKLDHGVWKMWALPDKEVLWMKLLSCIIGCVGSSVWGALLILLTKGQDISDSFGLSFCYVSLASVLTLWKCNSELLKYPVSYGLSEEEVSFLAKHMEQRCHRFCCNKSNARVAIWSLLWAYVHMAFLWACMRLHVPLCRQYLYTTMMSSALFSNRSHQLLRQVPVSFSLFGPATQLRHSSCWVLQIFWSKSRDLETGRGCRWKIEVTLAQTWASMLAEERRRGREVRYGMQEKPRGWTVVNK